MGKMILVDGVPHRLRRGKLVPIPKEWVGRHTTPKTIRQRPSKLHGKLKRVVKDQPCNINRFKDRRQGQNLRNPVREESDETL